MVSEEDKCKKLQTSLEEFFMKYKNITISIDDLSSPCALDWYFDRERWNANPKEYIHEIEEEIDDLNNFIFFKVSYYHIHFRKYDSKDEFEYQDVCGDEELFNKYMKFINTMAEKYTEKSWKMNEAMEELLYLDLFDMETS